MQIQRHRDGDASEQPDQTLPNPKSQLISKSLRYGAVAALITTQVRRTSLDMLLIFQERRIGPRGA
jgi:hypothetical protein